MQSLLTSILVAALFVSCAKLEKAGIKLNKYPHKSQKEVFQLAWAKNLDPVSQTGNLSIGYGTPIIHNEKVYFSDKLGFINVFDLASGRQLHKIDEGKQLSGKLGIYNGKLFYSSISGRVYVRDLVSMKLDYAIDLKAPVESAPLFHQGRAIYHLRNHQILALDAVSGKILWSYKRAIPYSTTLQRVSVPEAKGSRLFVGFADGYVGGFSLEEGVLEWETKITNANKFVDVDVRPVLFQGKLVVSSANGTLKYLSPQTGGQILSVEATPGHTPVVDGSRIVFGTVDGKVIIVDGNGQIAYNSQVSQAGISSLAIWKKGYVVSTYDGNLFYLSKENMKVEGKWHLGTGFSTVFGRLVVSKSHLAVYSSRNRLYIFR